MSIFVPNSDVQGLHGPVRRSNCGAPAELGWFSEESGQIVLTAYENWQNTVRRFPNNKALGNRVPDHKGEYGPYQWLTYAQANERVNNFGAGLMHLDLAPDAPDKELNDRGCLGIYSKNRVEWVICEQACYAYARIPVPLYDTFNAATVTYLKKMLGASQRTMVCSAGNCFDTLIEAKPNCPNLKYVVCMDEVTADMRSRAEAVGMKVWSFLEVEEAGKKNPKPHHPPGPEDIMTFCFTSGTTGDPKGALLAHKNLTSNFAGVVRSSGWNVEPTDIHLSYLPLPHIFERCVQVGIISQGCQIGFYQGDTQKIVEDLQELRPTVFPSVPRLLNRIYDKLIGGVKEAGGIKQKLFEFAYDQKLQNLRSDNSYTHFLWDKLVFSKIKEKVGFDRLRIIITGSAPISGQVMEFLRIAFCCPVVEGYGQTENAAAAFITHVEDATIGHVGHPVACNETVLFDVPDMDYLSTDKFHGDGEDKMPCLGRGEICLRGPNVFKGYYKDPVKTAETIDKHGWLHTGDVGIFTADGKLKIVDRKKNIFKLSQGEYVAAEKIENIYLKSSFVAQNFVYGDSLQSCLVAIVVLDPDQTPIWAAANGLGGKSLQDLASDPKLKKAIMDDLVKISRKNKLHGFEIAKDIHIEPVAWTPEDILTPTFKLQRRYAKEKYMPQIEAMYKIIGDAPGTSKM